jgi:toxin ParE1/3/4
VAYKVVLRSGAVADLKSIFTWVAEEADLTTALAYDRRIREACRKLADFPGRGTPRDLLIPGLRSVAFERRATIYYLIGEKSVRIVRILSAGQDPAWAFKVG